MAAESINLEALPVDRIKFGRSLLDGSDDLTYSFRSAYWPAGDFTLAHFSAQFKRFCGILSGFSDENG
jgi:hypothetical protein